MSETNLQTISRLHAVSKALETIYKKESTSKRDATRASNLTWELYTLLNLLSCPYTVSSSISGVSLGLREDKISISSHKLTWGEFRNWVNNLNEVQS